MAYDALAEWAKDKKKKKKGNPYEVYVTDPIDKDGKPVDPYKIRTDIVFPHN
jgi:effector-binding domain-containing protein